MTAKALLAKESSDLSLEAGLGRLRFFRRRACGELRQTAEKSGQQSSNTQEGGSGGHGMLRFWSGGQVTTIVD
jgi:hypothetical protein